jgi:hypothetical protein
MALVLGRPRGGAFKVGSRCVSCGSTYQGQADWVTARSDEEEVGAALCKNCVRSKLQALVDDPPVAESVAEIGDDAN